MADLRSQDVLVLVPAYNETRTIGGLARRVAAKGYRLLVVDDGSKDDTADRARQAGAQVLRLERNRGKGGALREGMKRFLDTRQRALVLMDADGQHDPEDLDVILAAANRTGADAVVGNRMDDASSMPPVRRWTNRLLSAVISLLAGQRVPDSQCGFRLIRRPIVERWRLRTERFELDSEMILEAARLGGCIASVPVRCLYGAGQKSNIRPLHDTLRFLRFLAARLASGRSR